jgi:hypothetical protein
VEALDPGPVLEQRLGEPESLERGHPGGLEEQSGAERPGVLEALEDLDGMPRAVEEEGGGGSRRAAADDPDPQGPPPRPGP